MTMSVQYKSLHKGILLRLYLIYFIFLLAALVIIARIIDIQFVQGDYWKEQFNKQAIKAFIIPATKGNIYSSDGSLLATSIPKFDIYFDALACQSDSIYYKNIDKLAYHLDTLTKGFNNFKILLKKAREKKIRYLPIIKNVSYQELKIIKEFPLFNLGRNLGGLIIEEKDKRILPNGDLAARTIGFERIPAFDVIMNLSKIPDVIFEKQVDSLAICMSQLFIDKKKEYYIDILKKAKKNNSKKFMLAKNIRKDKLDKLFTTYLISQGQNKWIKIDTVIKQFYVGIEGAYREYLKGKEGLQIRKKLANGLWKPLFDENQIEPENGCDVISTINLNLQDVASSSLKSHLIAQGAEGGCAI